MEGDFLRCFHPSTMAREPTAINVIERPQLRAVLAPRSQYAKDCVFFSVLFLDKMIIGFGSSFRKVLIRTLASFLLVNNDDSGILIDGFSD